ncbi:hypothetical protein KCU65_g3555, partial [Aureobasidium melanogenum]
MQPSQGPPASASNQAPDSQSSTLNASNHIFHDSASADNRIVRSIPPWVLTEDDSDDESVDQTQRLLPPSNAVPASHHYLPAPPTQHKAPGRKWDHIRSAEPPLLDQPIDTNQQRWLPYMLSGPQPRGVPGARLVSEAWMDENMPHLTSTWHAAEPEKPEEKTKGLWLFTPERRSKTFARIKRIILKNPFVPLVFRLIVLSFTVAALGLGARVFHEADAVNRQGEGPCSKRASTYMAIVLDSVAVPYIGYITWDEYLSKPLGLRSATAKVSLLLVDLFFIVFYSSNLSLALDALDDPRWACFDHNESLLSNCPASPRIFAVPRHNMRLFLLPISTRRTLLYCDRVATQVNASGKLSYHDRIVNKANETWASWENSPNKYKKKLTDYGNIVFNRISYEEWGLKTLPSSTADLTPTEIVFPGRFLDQKKVPEILRRMATERQGLHKQRFWGSLIGLPFTIPVGLLPIIPNIPGFYLAFRAWSHFKAYYGSKYLEALISSKEPLIKMSPSKTLDTLYAAGLIHPSREHARQAALPSEKFQEVAELVAQQTNNDASDVMLLKRWNGKLLAERFNLPGMELEIERAVEQVQKNIEADSAASNVKGESTTTTAENSLSNEKK